jgi:hypothetical protein
VYGPESPFTQILKHHLGVQRYREAWKAAGYPSVFAPQTFPIEEVTGNPLTAFLQENVKLLLSLAGFGSTTPEGPINPLGGVVGSYEIQALKLDEHVAMFVVKNETTWASGTRIPGTDLSALPALERGETDVLINFAVTMDVSLAPMVVAAPWTIPGILVLNRGVWELSRVVPGGWGGLGGTMIQYYYWMEPISEQP